MTISDKIRIYELSRDLNLENKDILDAAQKLSISVKSHSSSITAEDAKKIKNLINNKTSDKKIVAPFKGILGKREIAQGVLGTESFILTLDDTTSILLNIKVPEIYLNILKPGLSAEVKSDSFEKKFFGTIESVSSRVDPSTRSVLASIIVENKDLKLIPGMLLDIKIIYDKKEQLGIPENSLLIQGETAFVYKVLEDNTVNKIKVKIGKRNFGKVSIIDGLSLGDKIVTEGISKVRDKIKIKILN